MVKYKIELLKDECIACGNCYMTDPDHFEEDDEGFAQVVGGETTDEISEGTFEDDKIDNAKIAEDECPVTIITVEKL